MATRRSTRVKKPVVVEEPAPTAVKRQKVERKTESKEEAKASGIAIGAPAPNFSVVNQDEVTVTLDSLKGKRAVFYFYPKDSTPGW